MVLRGAERLTDDQRTTLFAKLLTPDPDEDIAAGVGCATRSMPP